MSPHAPGEAETGGVVRRLATGLSPYRGWFMLLAAAAFVGLWSTGFVVARIARPAADLSLFLSARFAAASLVLAGLAVVLKVAFPPRERIAFHLAIGALMNGVYLVGGYWAVGHGLSVGLMALIGALQPVFVAIICAAVYGIRLSASAIAGLVAATFGVGLVLWPLISGSQFSGSILTVVVAFLSVGAMSVGAVVQQTPRAMDAILPTTALHNAGSVPVALIAFALFGEAHWDGTMELWLVLAWSVLAVSVGAVLLFIALIRAEQASRASMLLLLVPPLAAVQGFLLFGDTLSAVQLAGFVIALLGVLQARRA